MLARRIAGAAILFGTFLPAWMIAVGHFPSYYAWMKVIPQAVCVLAAAAHFWPAWCERVGRGIVAMCVIVASLGFPLRVAISLADAEVRNYAPVQSFVDQQIFRDDHVIASYLVYFTVRSTPARCS